MSLSNHSLIKGTYLPPGDKSISHRILILAGQAIGKSIITNLLEGEDVINTIKAMKLLGVQIKKRKRNITFLVSLLEDYMSHQKQLISVILELE